ncbi:MAG TPA: tetratricopeptide repeat protein [Myxococcales bacterium]|nr:tetratricopeptide repeat protein [Myxococcales bacterium]
MSEPASSDQPMMIQVSLVPLAKSEAVLMLQAGYLWMDLGEHVKAREVFTGIAALMPRSEAPQLAMGTLELVQGRHDKALQTFRAAQRLAPKSGLPRAHVAEALLFMGKVPEAMKELKAAREIEPDGDGARLAQALIEAVEDGTLPPPAARKDKQPR